MAIVIAARISGPPQRGLPYGERHPVLLSWFSDRRPGARRGSSSETLRVGMAASTANAALTRLLRHLGDIHRLLIAPSKWDTSNETLELNVADIRRFLRHNLAAVG